MHSMVIPSSAPQSGAHAFLDTFTSPFRGRDLRCDGYGTEPPRRSHAFQALSDDRGLARSSSRVTWRGNRWERIWPSQSRVTMARSSTPDASAISTRRAERNLSSFRRAARAVVALARTSNHKCQGSAHARDLGARGITWPRRGGARVSPTPVEDSHWRSVIAAASPRPRSGHATLRPWSTRAPRSTRGGHVPVSRLLEVDAGTTGPGVDPESKRRWRSPAVPPGSATLAFDGISRTLTLYRAAEPKQAPVACEAGCHAGSPLACGPTDRRATSCRIDARHDRSRPPQRVTRPPGQLCLLRRDPCRLPPARRRLALTVWSVVSRRAAARSSTGALPLSKDVGGDGRPSIGPVTRLWSGSLRATRAWLRSSSPSRVVDGGAPCVLHPFLPQTRA